MSIYVSEPGRPVGTRLPETFRARPVGDVTELAETKSINPGRSEATDAEFQQAANAGRYKTSDADDDKRSLSICVYRIINRKKCYTNKEM